MARCNSLIVAVVALLSLTCGASAHAVLTVPEVVAGGYATTGVRIGHGCEDEPVETVIVSLPEDFVRVRPRQLAFWNITTTEHELTYPTEVHGDEVATTVSEIVWSGFLPLDQYQEFEFQFYTRPATDEGVLQSSSLDGMRHIPINVTQVCATLSVAWVEVEDDSQYPAPVLMVEEPHEDAHAHHG